MVGSRTATAIAGVLLSLAISAGLWYAFGTAVFFLFVPIVPFLFRRASAPEVRTCPTCGFRTRATSYTFCPRDGSRLD